MVHLNLTFLDTFQVSLDQQPITHFRSANNQGLLIYIALQSGKPLSRDLLVTLFWPEESTRNGRNNLRQSLHRLRSLLGDLDSPETPYLLVTRQTVQFNPESSYNLDVKAFLDAVDRGDLETAVSHYAGDLLPGFTVDSLEFEEWLRQERESLHHLALETMLEATRDCLRDGRLDEAQAIARQQLRLEPWREQAHRQLMQAFALAGDRGNAVAQYDVCREVLAEDLDIEPAEETVKLYEDIRSNRYGSIASIETLLPPIKARQNLPADTTALIGRELEKAQVGQLLSQDGERLVTIVGLGGMGKTRLALAVGVDMLEKYRNGVYFVDLAPLDDPDEIGLAIASALNYQAPDNSRALFPQLLKTISRQNLLLILDNFEQLLDGAAVVNEVLQACPEIAVLATSRQRLNLASESRYELGGLATPEGDTQEDALEYAAVQLFVANGKRAQPELCLTDENVTHIIRICQMMQGLPLGLVLAASWLDLLSPAEIAAEIERNLDFLAADLTDLPPRQRSIQAVFDHSWQMLTPLEQTVLAKLSVFRGGFTREAAEQVAGANLRVLLALVNKSLLQRQAESGRFHMHDLLRQFAATKRQRIDPDAHASLAHCHYFAQIVLVEVEQSLWTHPLNLPEKYGAEWDNFRQAWSYGLANGLVEVLADMAQGMIIFNLRQGIRPATLITRALQSLKQQGISEKTTSMLRLRLAELIALTGYDDAHHVEQLMLDYISLVEQQPDLELRFWAYCLMLSTMSFLDKKQIPAWQSKAIQVAVEMENETYVKAMEAAIFWTRTMLFNEKEPIEPMQTLATFFEHHFPDSAIFQMLLRALSIQSVQRGKYGQAIHYARQALQLAIKWRDLYWIENACSNLAEIYIQTEQLQEAKLQLLAALEWHLAIGQEWQIVGCVVFGIVSKYSDLFGSKKNVVVFLSMAYYHPESPPHFLQQIDSIKPQFEEALGYKRFATAWEKGKELDLDLAIDQVRVALQSGEGRTNN